MEISDQNSAGNCISQQLIDSHFCKSNGNKLKESLIDMTQIFFIVSVVLLLLWNHAIMNVTQKLSKVTTKIQVE